MKKILITLLITLFIFLIYIQNKDQKIYYLVLGDTYNKEIENIIKNKLKKQTKLEIYNKDYTTKVKRINEQIEEIKTNKHKLNNKTIQNALIKADLITISIGLNDIKEKKEENQYEYIDKSSEELDILIKEIKKYSKEKIIVIGYSDKKNVSKSVLSYLDRKYKEICIENNVSYIKNNKSATEIAKQIINEIK